MSEGKQVGTLYHFTDETGIEGILKSNQLLASTTNASHVSLTRDKDGWHVGTLDNIFRISLDGNKISNNYKIQPYSWSQFDRGLGDTESEEAVLTDKITHIKGYIISILIDQSLSRLMGVNIESLINLLKEKNIPYEFK